MNALDQFPLDQKSWSFLNLIGQTPLGLTGGLGTEGTFLPNVGGTATYTLQQGSYLTIGSNCFVHGTIVINAIGTGSTNTISGFPSIGFGTAFALSAVSGLSVAVVSLTGGMTNGQSAMTLYSRTAANVSESAAAVLTSGSSITFSGWYRIP